VVEVVGGVVFAVAWIAGAVGGGRGLRHAPGRASGLARTLRALGTYAVVAVPYLAVCFVLWRPLPVTVTGVAGWAVLAVGTASGAFGAMLYLWGRRTLGDMYNVSSAFGAELFGDQRLVVTGPYRVLRHPMYAGLFCTAAGALLVYRVWAMVFVVACLPGAWIKARREDALLAAQFGERFEDYRRTVPGWWPRRVVDSSVTTGSAPSPPVRRQAGAP